MEQHNKGAWTDAEHQKYLEGYSKFGKNWQAIETFVGTRSKAQISMHHRHFILKTTGALPESNRKRKNQEEGSLDSKKAKSTGVEPSKTATPKQKATPSKKVTSSTKGTTKATPTAKPAKSLAAPTRTSTKKSEDILPPAAALSRAPAPASTPAEPPAAAPAPAKKSPVKIAQKPEKPEKVDPIAKDTTSAPYVEETISETSPVVDFLRREEVQTVIAGVVGFLSVIIVKKLMG